MEGSSERCQLCNGHTIQLSEQEFRCIECNYLNHRSK